MTNKKVVKIGIIGLGPSPSFALKKNGNFLLSSKLQCHYFS